MTIMILYYSNQPKLSNDVEGIKVGNNIFLRCIS